MSTRTRCDRERPVRCPPTGAGHPARGGQLRARARVRGDPPARPGAVEPGSDQTPQREPPTDEPRTLTNDCGRLQRLVGVPPDMLSTMRSVVQRTSALAAVLMILSACGVAVLINRTFWTICPVGAYLRWPLEVGRVDNCRPGDSPRAPTPTFLGCDTPAGQQRLEDAEIGRSASERSGYPGDRPTTSSKSIDRPSAPGRCSTTHSPKQPSGRLPRVVRGGQVRCTIPAQSETEGALFCAGSE